MKMFYFSTTNPRKTCVVAKHLGSDVDYEFVNLFQREHHANQELLSVNPNAKVPALVDGERKLFESTAIMMYLAQRAGSDMWPSDPDAQTDAMMWLAWDISHFTKHAGTVYFEHYIKQQVGMGPVDEAAVAEAVEFFRQFGGVLDNHLAERDFVLGDTFTIVDVGVATTAYVAREMDLPQLPVGEFGNLTRWLDRLGDIPAFRDPWPDQ